MTNGGKIDFWVTNDNKLAGRGREYEVVLIDEAAFTKAPEMLEEIWPKSIKPTLLVPRGYVWVFSTPDGIDENNFFYALCNNKKLGFFEHYAPTSSNPYVPAEELEQEEKNCEPRVFRQEFLAEFVDWSKDALFDINKWLVDGKPVAMPETCDLIFAVADTALKGGQENDGTGVVYYAYTYNYVPEPELRIIDWDLTQIQGALLPEYIPGVYENLNRLSRICKPRMGSGGVFMEDAAMGAILLQKAETEGWDMKAIDSVLTGKGKDERAVMASGYHYLGRCKITEEAFNKTVPFKQAEANHLWKQVAGFHLADKKAHVRADDLLDGYMYGLIIAFTITMDGRQGDKLSDVILRALQVTYQNSAQKLEINVNIHQNLVLYEDWKAIFRSIFEMSQMLKRVTPGMLGQRIYSGVNIAVQKNKINVFDGSDGKQAKPMLARDLIGQPTWLEPQRISIKTSMRADIEVGDWITLPFDAIGENSILAVGNQMGQYSEKQRLSFSGTYEVMGMRHIGDYYNVSEDGWVTVFEAVPRLKDVVDR